MSIITLSRVHLCFAGSHVALFQISSFSLLQDLRPLNGFDAVPAQYICACAVVSRTPPAHDHNSPEQRNIIVQSPEAPLFCFLTSGCTTGYNPGNVTRKWKWEREKRRSCVENVRQNNPEKPRCEMSPDNDDRDYVPGVREVGIREMPHRERRHVLWAEGCHAAGEHPKLESSKKQRKSSIGQERYWNRGETYRKTAGLITKEKGKMIVGSDSLVNIHGVCVISRGLKLGSRYASE